MEHAVIRRIVGTAAAVLLAALAWLGLDRAFAPPAGSYEVTAVLGRAGSGLDEGTDVKLRGVRVGTVSGLDFVDGQAIATIRFEPDVRVPRNGLELVVTAKTLLGEKQIELSHPASSGEPYVAPGDRLEADRRPTELHEAIAVLEPFLAAVDPQELATIVEVLGQQKGEGENIRRALDTSAEVARFAERTADQTIGNVRRLTSIADQLTPAASEFDRLNRNLPAAVAILSERTAAIDSNLDVLTTFAGTLTSYLDVEEERIRHTLATGDVVGAFLERNADAFGSFVEGAGIYFKSLGRPANILDDGSVYGPFKIFLDLSQLGLPIGTEGPIDLSPYLGSPGGDLTEDLPPLDLSKLPLGQEDGDG